MTRLALAAFVAALSVACDDTAPAPFRTGDAGPSTDATTDATTPVDLGPVGGGAEDLGRPSGPDLGPPPGEPPAFVRLTLTPRQTVYARSEPPRVTAEVFDRFGELLPSAPLQWAVAPAAAGAVTPDPSDAHAATLRLDAEGQGAVRACALPDVCGRATFFVDDVGATLQLDTPQPGEVQTSETPEIVVAGTAAGGAGVRVFVNDREVAVGQDGRFETRLPARFGFNRVDVLADDGVRRPAAREVREVVWAPSVVPAGPGVTPTPDALVLRIGQRLLDDGAALPAPDDAGALRATSVAGLVEALLAQLDLAALLGDPVVARGEPLSLEVAAARPGQPDATLLWTSTGLEIFLRLRDLSIDTRGGLTIDQTRYGLDGGVRVDAAGFVRVAIEPGPDGTPGLRIESADVAIERLAGQMADPTAQAVLDTVGSLLRGVLEGVARDLVGQVVRERLPAFIELGLGDALSSLRGIPVELVDDPLVPPFRLVADLTLATPAPVARGHMDLRLDGVLTPVGAPAPPHPSPGIPLAEPNLDAQPPWPAQVDAAAALRLFTVNALLHAMWQQGALRIDAASLLPENLRGLLVGAQVDALAAPLVAAAPPGSAFPLELQLGELELRLFAPNRDTPDVYAMSVRAGLQFELSDAEQLTMRLTITDDPDLRAVLRSSGAPTPVLSADVLAQLIEALAWPKVGEAIGDGLTLDLVPFALSADTLGAVAPAFEGARLRVVVPQAPRVGNDWIVVPAGLEFSAAPAAP